MLCGGGSDPEAKEREKISAQIEKQLKDDAKKSVKDIKLLLLGAGECGKSTFAKQMKIINLNGYNEDEKKTFRDIIHANVLNATKSLIQGCKKLGIAITPPNQGHAEAVVAWKYEQGLQPEIVASIKQLWQDEGIKSAYQRADEFQLIDVAAYLLNDLDRVATAGYMPSEEDIVRSRQTTTSILETVWIHNGFTFRMVDVGGQRNQRSKWMHCFEGVTAVLFVVALNDYNLKLREDENVNRMHESIQLFETTLAIPWFKETNFILFFNKIDLFKEKIEKVDMKVCFPEYSDGCNYDKALAFIQEKFRAKNKNTPTRGIYMHVTCATDKGNVRKVFDDVRHMLLKDTISEIGI